MIKATGNSHPEGGCFPQRHHMTVGRAEQVTLDAIFAAS
jgi:hypothetical protein